MNKNHLLLSSLLISTSLFSQVGINTETPMTTLDVSTKKIENNLDITQNYGLQAPRLTKAELVSLSSVYNTDHKGALIYITDITGTDTTSSSAQRVNIKSVGYYYFDGAVWQKIQFQNIYTNDGAITDTFRNIRTYNSTSQQAAKVGFSGSLVNFTTTSKGRLPAFSFVGGEKTEIYLPNDITIAEQDKRGEGSGTLFTNSLIGFYPKYSQLLSNQFGTSTELWQMITGRSKGVSENDLFIGGINDSKSTRNANNIHFVVDGDRIETNYANDNSNIAMSILGTGTTIAENLFRPTVGINNVDLYLSNLEYGTTANPAPVEKEGQILTLIKNPFDQTKLKAVWRNPTSGGTVNTEPWNVENTTNQASSNVQNIYQRGFVGIGDFSGSNLQAALHIVNKGNGSNYASDNIIMEGQSNIDNDPLLILRRSRVNLTSNALEKVSSGDYVGTIQFQAHNGTNYISNKTGIRGLVTNDDANVDMIFFNNTVGTVLERMRLTSAGNFGIGTNNPIHKLEVNGIIKGTSLTNGSTIYTNTDLGLYNQQNQYTRIASTTGVNSAVAIYTDGTTANNFTGTSATMIAKDGKVGIGIGNGIPSAKLNVKREVSDTTPLMRLENLETGSGANLVIDANGYVKKSTTVAPTMVSFSSNYTLASDSPIGFFKYTGSSNANFILPEPSADQITNLKQITIINTSSNYIYFDASGSSAPKWTTTDVFNRIGNGSRVTFIASPTSNGNGEWLMLHATTGNISY